MIYQMFYDVKNVFNTIYRNDVFCLFKDCTYRKC